VKIGAFLCKHNVERFLKPKNDEKSLNKS